ncbi:hypothetical protein [uncultured Pseudokineococcus sp.]|uniref:hypothetical protein n=1 Tax=uncultured Pseudokineococcus sp. TaxID=1642928 RepID=UPI0026370F7F|nr:hypothetical protein [uncultured Pseudokineococcus sp.]
MLHRPKPVPPPDRGTRDAVVKAVLLNLAWLVPRLIVLSGQVILALLRIVGIALWVSSGDVSALPDVLDVLRDAAAAIADLFRGWGGGAG